MLGIKVEPIALNPYSRDSSKSLAKLSQRSANRSAHALNPSDASAQNFRVVQYLRKGLGHTRPKPHQFYDESKTSALGSGEPQLRNDCLIFGASKRSWGSAVPGEGDQFSL